jgi:transposase-like protein
MDPLPDDVQDEEACYARLVRLLHPNGLSCPRCHARDGLGIHRRRREPVMDYQCSKCRRVFNAWTGTPLQKTHRSPCQLLKILRGMARGVSTAQLARDLGCQRAQLLLFRHRLQRQGGLKLGRQLVAEDAAEGEPAGSGETWAHDAHPQLGGLHARSPQETPDSLPLLPDEP